MNTLNDVYVGQALCQSAIYTSAAFSCGTLDDTVGEDFFPVVSMDGCPGDSGGTWYSIISSTRRRAVGYHQGQGPGEPVGSCHVAGYHSNFTFASDAKTYLTQNSAATFTIVTR